MPRPDRRHDISSRHATAAATVVRQSTLAPSLLPRELTNIPPEAVQTMRRAASAYPPFVVVKPDKMSPAQWVLRLEN
jgi:hypothetical protein